MQEVTSLLQQNKPKLTLFHHRALHMIWGDMIFILKGSLTSVDVFIEQSKNVFHLQTYQYVFH